MGAVEEEVVLVVVGFGEVVAGVVVVEGVAYPAEVPEHDGVVADGAGDLVEGVCPGFAGDG